ncbi:MAG: molybdate ABC transporter substrate-binding protein [Denitrovibrio sp.]|nr:MAG: molybdate ABC transporter substrate-binding protein [Denitrovibrio sp.]
MKNLLILLLMFIATVSYAEKITIYAAASTTNALNEIISEYKKSTDVDVVASFASSGTLAKQISNSAPADIFLSANKKWMTYLKDKNKVKAETISPLLSNRLALIAPVTSPIKPTELDNATATKILSNGVRIALADPAHSPAGKYALKTLESLGLWTELSKNAVRMQTVRVALAMVERNAVPFGIVYSSDAALSNKAKVIGLFNEELHGAIRYPSAIVTGKDTASVVKFYHFLKSEQSATIFEKYGFTAVK